MTKIPPRWQRARRPEQKVERRTAILDAAAALLDEDGLSGTGLNAIARESNISKPNIYRYFESREAILLDLLLTEAASWARTLERRLRKLAGTDDVDATAKVLADTITKRRRFCVLIGALATVLEHNVGVKTLTAFKREFLATVDPAVTALDAALSELSPEQAFYSLAMFIMAASGAWPHCHPSPVVEKVLAQREFASMRLDFRRTMQDYAVALLKTPTA